MRTIRTKVYKFNELSEDVQQSVIEKMFDVNMYYDWYETIYEDAENVGLKITGFDTDRGSYCDIEYLQDECYTANEIIKEHGNTCSTYLLAEAFLKERDEAIDTWPKDEDGDFEYEGDLDAKLDDLKDEFLKDLSAEYLSMLRNEIEYLCSKESIVETIIANDYEFTKEGNRF